jgi:hypothetical protein
MDTVLEEAHPVINRGIRRKTQTINLAVISNSFDMGGSTPGGQGYDRDKR